jgi:hypothetical protein
MAVIIRCNRCSADEERGEKFYGIHLSLGKDSPQTRGHLCPSCAEKVVTENKLPPLPEAQEQTLKERLK